MYLTVFDSQCCCLCRKAATLTREHKIKKSQLNDPSGNLYVGSAEGLSRVQFDSVDKIIGSYHGVKIAQGKNSNSLKFGKFVCVNCNTSRTQVADRAYDDFRKWIRNLTERNFGEGSRIRNWDFSEKSERHTNLARYFAKLLCCHFAEDGIPIPVRLGNFAIGVSDENCIFLTIQEDKRYEVSEMGAVPLSGLFVLKNDQTDKATRFQSSVSYLGNQIIYEMEWSANETLELMNDHSHVFSFLTESLKRGMSNPEMHEQGLKRK